MSRLSLIKDVLEATISLIFFLILLFISLIIFSFGNPIGQMVLIGMMLLALISIICSLFFLNRSIWESINTFLHFFIFTVQFLLFAFIVGEFETGMIILWLILGLLTFLISLYIEKKALSNKITEWINNGKVDLDRNRIKVLIPWLTSSQPKALKWAVIGPMLIGLIPLWKKILIRGGTDFTLAGYLVGIIGLLGFYLLSLPLIKIIWIISYQRMTKSKFYNELGVNYNIKELFLKKKRRKSSD